MTPRLAVLYFFFSYAQGTQKTENIIKLLLRQILQQLGGNIPESVKREYRTFKKDPDGNAPSPKILTQLLQECISYFAKVSSNQVFVLFDAFDEFKSRENEETERMKLLNFF